MTFHLDIYGTAAALWYRRPGLFSGSAFFVTGLSGGVSLTFLGAPLETVVLFAVAVLALVTAACISLFGTGALRRYKRYEPALFISCSICIGLILGNWLAGLLSLGF